MIDQNKNSPASPASGPAISSIGPPPERHAERIVGEMLAWLHVENHRLWQILAGSLDLNQMGNPVGQERAVRRFRDKAKPLLLDFRLVTGKRGKYKLTLVTWEIWDVVNHRVADASGLLPPYGCLAVGFAQKRGRGWPDGKAIDRWRYSTTLIISRHACLRLAMRAEVKTVPDLLAAVRELWETVAVFVNELPDEEVVREKEGDEERRWWQTAPPEGWRLTMPRGTVAVVGQYNDSPRLVVKTILD